MPVPRKRLSEIAHELAGAELIGTADPEITAVHYDSRQVTPGSLFVAIPGLKTDGTEFIDDARRRGAAAVIVEKSAALSSTLPTIRVDHARRALAESAWALFDHPERKLISIGVTGTNGKTTTASLLRQVLEQSGHKTGLIGTLGIFYGETEVESPRTTPESSDIAMHFAAMRELGFSHVVMEATSIGIDLQRVWQIPFRAAVFTNLTRDHLDYHGTESAYLEAKLRLFRELPSESTAVINLDDPAGAQFVRAATGRSLTYSLNGKADYCAEQVQLRRNSTRFRLRSRFGDSEIYTPLIGQFNVYNMLGVIASADSLGVPREATVNALAKVQPVRGRAEVVPLNSPFTVIVDYAHTPDALDKILTTLRALDPTRIITLIGAGGDRDRGKRPLMAQVAERLSDLVILTSDNPRSEDPIRILEDMAVGLCTSAAHVREVDRRKAIIMALNEARGGDIVLVAGKGHETYQEIKGVKLPFDDRQVILDEFSRIGLQA